MIERKAFYGSTVLSGRSPRQSGTLHSLRRSVLWAALNALLLIGGHSASAQVYSLQSGDIVAANYRAGGNTVVRVDPQTGTVRRLGLFDFPTDVAVSSDGFLYVSELGGLVKRLNLTNGVQTVVNPHTTLSQVWGLALSPAGDLYLTSSADNRIVRVDTVTGQETTVIQGGLVSVPTGIDFLDSNTLVVGSRGNNQVVSISLLNQVQTVLASGADGMDLPWGVAVFANHVYAGAHDSRLLFSITGTMVTNILPVWAPKLGGDPFGLATDAEGNVVVGVSGGLSGPYVLERRDSQGNPLPSFDGNYIGEITGIEVSRISVLAESQVNTPPGLAQVGQLTVDEGATLSFAAAATDSDWPIQELTCMLVGDVPAGVNLSSAGVLTWKPDEAQGPSTNALTLVVFDDGLPSLSATQTFNVVVNELNVAPVVTPVGNKTTSVGTSLGFKVNATDADLPAQTLTFSLDAAAPPGASITSDGQFSWTPGATPGPGAYTVGVVVTDNGAPALSDTNYFIVTVFEANVAPVFGPVTNQYVDEGTRLSYQVVAGDSNTPPQNLTFGFARPGPPGASISTNGLFTWMPSESQGPSSNIIAVRVTDNGLPPLSTTNEFTVVVREVNLAPVWNPIPRQTVSAGQLLSFRVTANDVDLPAQKLTYSLGTGAPTGATLSPAGDFSWTPAIDTPAGSWQVPVQVVDDGAPPLTTVSSVTIDVRGGFNVQAGDILVADYGADTVIRIDARNGMGQPMGTFAKPTDVALGTNGMLYVAEQGGTVRRLNLVTGEIALVNTNTSLYDLRGIVVGPTGDLFVACAGNDSVVRINPQTGAETLVTQGNLLSGPYGIDLLDPQNLVVSSLYNNRIVLVALTNNTQHLVSEGNGISQPWGVATSGGTIFLVSWGSQAVQALSNGSLSNLAAVPDGPCGIGVSQEGNIAVSVNAVAPRIECFGPGGTTLTNYQAGLTGYCMGVEVAAFPAGLTSAPTLEWSQDPGGPFAADPQAVVDSSTRTITTSRRLSSCFYRLGGTSGRILELRLESAQVLLRYE